MAWWKHKLRLEIFLFQNYDKNIRMCVLTCAATNATLIIAYATLTLRA